MTQGLHFGPMPLHVPGRDVLTLHQKQLFLVDSCHIPQPPLSIKQVHPWQMPGWGPTLLLALSFPVLDRDGKRHGTMGPVQLNGRSPLFTPHMIPHCDRMLSNIYFVKGDFLSSLVGTMERGLFRWAQEVMLWLGLRLRLKCVRVVPSCSARNSITFIVIQE